MAGSEKYRLISGEPQGEPGFAGSDELPEALKTLIAGGWGARDARGAEDRLALGERRAFVPVQDLLRKDPHLEMHTRGG